MRAAGNESKSGQSKHECRFDSNPKPRPCVERLLDQLLIDRWTKTTYKWIECRSHDAWTMLRHVLVCDGCQINAQYKGELVDNHLDVEAFTDSKPVRNAR